MVARRRIPSQQGKQAIELVRQALAATDPAASFQALPRASKAQAVRFLLEELAAKAPGNSVEVRVPPYGVTQCIPGPRHTRGTPANVVEMDGLIWCSLGLGFIGWQQAKTQILASGLRADLSAWLPLF
ncbi:MAG: sterol carrier family protein [Rothia sp. (in: high G+C Gram-positive bacteria)]|nr:sterol carrier family protein [Rothia sp. (in: high G+C Gram-positive bacteria)]